MDLDTAFHPEIKDAMKDMPGLYGTTQTRGDGGISLIIQ
jgi:hypothetical protein